MSCVRRRLPQRHKRVQLKGCIQARPSSPANALSASRAFIEAFSQVTNCQTDTGKLGGDWIKVNGRFTRLVGVDIRAPAEKVHLARLSYENFAPALEVPAVRLDLSPSLPAATFSLALSEKDPFVATV